MASLSLEDVRKRFGRTEVLKGIDLAVADGEFCVLLGPSGCGKSTLLNIIAGLVPQDRGRVSFDGRSVDHLAPRDRDVAMVFQNYALYPHLSVAENLGFGLRVRGVRAAEIRVRVRETAVLLGLEDFLERKPRELSGGQRQRVAMGRALVRRPRLFLLDEPLSNLDARLRAAVRLELKQLHQRLRGTTVYVTHDQVEAMTLGDRVVVMKDGLILQQGRPEEIYEAPADTFVARFIGAPEMNVFQGRMAEKDGRPFFQGRGFGLVLPEAAPGLAGAEVELGLRPEDLEVSPDGPLLAQVVLVNNLGPEKFALLRLGQESLTARLPKSAAPEPGEILGLAAVPGRIHLFLQGRRFVEKPPTS